MLPKCSLTCKIVTLTPEEALGLARKTFHNDAVALVEGLTQARLAPWTSITEEETQRCLRLVVMNKDHELRCERQHTAIPFVCRLITEGKGETFYVIETPMLLRNSSSLDKNLRAKGRGHILIREYYSISEEDGMPVFTAERLAGVTSA